MIFQHVMLYVEKCYLEGLIIENCLVIKALADYEKFQLMMHADVPKETERKCDTN
jgi:hypothetical protein